MTPMRPSPQELAESSGRATGGSETAAWQVFWLVEVLCVEIFGATYGDAAQHGKE
jgi:hypothetical protein